MPDANKKQNMASTLIETFDDRRDWIESDSQQFWIFVPNTKDYSIFMDPW